MDSAHAGRYYVEIEKYPQVAMYEMPIPQSDVTGNKQGVQARAKVGGFMVAGRPL
jgi:hypothetical protein